ncbi:MAG: nitrate reductase [Planctomycetota bacterium]
MTRQLVRTPGKFGLGQVPAKFAPDATTKAVCGFCSTGCGLNVHLQGGEAVSLTPATEYPVNLGMACPKGWEALAVLDAPDRATSPLMRDAAGELVPVDWDTALTDMVGRIGKIGDEHGRDAVAFLSTGQIAVEEMALLGAVAKFGLGMVHGDGNTRQCMATAVTAYKQSFGFDAPPYTYADYEQSDCLVFVGANPCIAHPIMWERVLRNQKSPEILVVDPRTTETATNATLHLPIASKSDQALFYGFAKLAIDGGHVDKEFVAAHTDGYADYADFVAAYDVARVAVETGLSEQTVRDAAERIFAASAPSFWWTMGVNQSHQGTRTAQAIINLALLLGAIGRPGTGANSITGQCNAMGSRLFSNTTALFAGRSFESERDRRETASVLGISAETIPDRPSYAYHEILEAVERGEVKALWVVATNPAHSWIDQNRFRRLRDKLDLLVVQDMYDSTETARLADIVLPAAAWGEKEGTFINSERRIGLLKKVKRAPGQALTDFDIFRLVAAYAGCGHMFEAWDSPEAVFGILQKLSAGRPCDVTGIGHGHESPYRHLDEAGGIQWPYPAAGAGSAAQDETERRLFEDGKFYHPGGRARLISEAPSPSPEQPDGDFPLLLLTGRGSASQWHTQTRTKKSAVLRKLYPADAYLEIHPDDAARLGVRTGEGVAVASRRGELTAKAFVTRNVAPGHVFAPMHDEHTNKLTNWVFDPYSKQPSYKSCAVRVAPADWG